MPRLGANGAATPPRYQRCAQTHVFRAIFPDGQAVEVHSERTRRYPGLAAMAPDTRALYAAAPGFLPKGAAVADVGSGAGLGALRLLEHFERVTAIESDPLASRFAQAYLPAERVVHVDASAAGELPQHAAACVVDVLGQVDAPCALLRAVRRLLPENGRLFLAEPRAYPAQTLVPPLVRAFSPPLVVELLTRAGLEVETWIENAGHFVACVARPAADDAWVWLERADAAFARGDAEGALAAYAELSRAQASLRVEALLGSAVVHAARGQLDPAGQCLLEAAALEPREVRPLSGLAELSLVAGENVQALSLAIRAVEADPCNLAAVQVMARAAKHFDAAQASASWRIANGLAPGDLASAIELSRAAAQAGRLTYAIWVLERLRDFQGELGAEFHVTLAWLYLNAERPGEARLEAELARLEAPGSASVSELCSHLESLSVAA